MTRFADWPHGLCECVAGCQCERNGAGPAVFEIVRNEGTTRERTMRVCSRCDLSSDRRVRMLVTGDDDAQTLVNYDALGAFVIINRLADAKEAS